MAAGESRNRSFRDPEGGDPHTGSDWDRSIQGDPQTGLARLGSSRTSSAPPGQDALIAAIVSFALSEDIGPGDATTQATVTPETRAVGCVVARANGVLSGLEAARAVVLAVDPDVSIEARRADGDALVPGDIVLVLTGRARSLLTMERTLLNFLQRLSGVATRTAAFVEAVAGTGVVIADTRKTTPGLRFLEKAAVRHGGGSNHRFGLYDACMIKDNHIVAAGSMRAAVERVRASARAGELYLTVEADTEKDAAEAARLGVDQILLDNMDPSEIAASVKAIRGAEAEAGLATRARIEVSGGISLETVRSRALPGVDLISVGALTHSAAALDIALELELEPGPDHPEAGCS